MVLDDKEWYWMTRNGTQIDNIVMISNRFDSKSVDVLHSVLRSLTIISMFPLNTVLLFFGKKCWIR